MAESLTGGAGGQPCSRWSAFPFFPVLSRYFLFGKIANKQLSVKALYQPAAVRVLVLKGADVTVLCTISVKKL